MARILIVDDDVDVVESIRLFLEREGHKVAVAYSRGGGMRAVAEWPPDLVVLDVMMDLPDDGIVMARDLRQAGFAFPIVMITSLPKVPGQPNAVDPSTLPVDALLDKPIRPAVLTATVAGLLAGRSAEPAEAAARRG